MMFAIRWIEVAEGSDCPILSPSTSDFYVRMRPRQRRSPKNISVYAFFEVVSFRWMEGRLGFGFSACSSSAPCRRLCMQTQPAVQ
jgi:hypothetical protein